MKILRRGPPKPQFVYQVTCPKCQSELEFSESDIQLTEMIRNEQSRYVVCLGCEKQISDVGWKKTPIPPEYTPRPPFKL
jgi:uncharacterized protein with PIN domain